MGQRRVFAAVAETRQFYLPTFVAIYIHATSTRFQSLKPFREIEFLNADQVTSRYDCFWFSSVQSYLVHTYRMSFLRVPPHVTTCKQNSRVTLRIVENRVAFGFEVIPSYCLN